MSKIYFHPTSQFFIKKEKNDNYWLGFREETGDISETRISAEIFKNLKNVIQKKAKYITSKKKRL